MFVEILDGFCMEHFMAFEAANGAAREPPFIKVDNLENHIQLRERLVEAGKYLLVRAYPGPLGNTASISLRNVLAHFDVADTLPLFLNLGKQNSPNVGWDSDI